jgi:hypothetical protein
MRHQPFVYVTQSSHHRSIAQAAISGQHGADTSAESLSISPMSHEIVLPQIGKTNDGFPDLIGFAYRKIFLQELLLHLSPRSDNVCF